MVPRKVFQPSNICHDNSILEGRRKALHMIMSKDEFTKLVLDNQGCMHRIAFGILKNEADTEDAVSETIVRAYEKLDTLRNPNKSSSWLMTILVNVSRDLVKKRKYMSDIDDLEIPDEAGSGQDSDLWMDVLSLEEEFRDVVILHYYEGFRVREISEILQIPSGTVKSRLKRARDKLAVILS